MTTRSTDRLNRVVRSVLRAALRSEPAPIPDGRLLETFVTGQDEAAFEMLVKRHGPMVLGVCRRVLGNVHDAEDAFQAVFLVLARKAATVVPRELVGNWLYGVAYRTALHARDRLGRHRARERQVIDMPQPTVVPEVDLSELLAALDEELARLPEKYRVPIVLCDLEGRSRREVADRLKIPEGTLSSRLAKGRELLAGRLARHGLVLSAALLTTALAAQSASALPAGLLSSTARAAALTAAGQSATAIVSADVIALSEGVLKTMFLDKLKVITLLVLGVLMGGLGAGIIGIPGRDAGPVVHAAAPDHPVQVQTRPAPVEEPLDGKLLLDEQVQKELRLGPNQVGRVQTLNREVNEKNRPNVDEIVSIEKQIAELQQRIATLEKGIERDRKQTLGKAAPQILSGQALKRLRQIQRQQRSLDQLLVDPRMQEMLKLDDEQIKKIEAIVKSDERNLRMSNANLYYQALGATLHGDTRTWKLLATQPDSRWHGDNTTVLKAATWLRAHQGIWYDISDSMSEMGLRQLFDVLTESQKRTLLDWIGEPYQSTSWHLLRNAAR
jgi:RNA polymerase sigma factor (sigma-70 family)